MAHQRRDASWFRQVVVPIEASLKGRLSYRLEAVFPYEGVAKGQNWDAMRSAIETWIHAEAPGLSDGRHELTIQGVPFLLTVVKASERGRRPGVWFMRYWPTDASLAQRVGEQVQRKLAKLARYRSQGYRTVLVVECDDIALMNSDKLLEAIRSALRDGVPADLDEVWYADSSVGDGSVRFEDFTARLGSASPLRAV